MKSFTVATLVAGFLLTSQSIAGAQVSFGIHIGPPPTPYVVNVVPVQPGPAYTWIDGYWYPYGHQYVWHNGYWAWPPYTGAYWVAPRYYNNAYYRRGYWGGNHYYGGYGGGNHYYRGNWGGNHHGHGGGHGHH